MGPSQTTVGEVPALSVSSNVNLCSRNLVLQNALVSDLSHGCLGLPKELMLLYNFLVWCPDLFVDTTHSLCGSQCDIRESRCHLA